MFSDEEIKEFDEQLKTMGITDGNERKEVLEYFYKLGKIIYKLNISSYGKEN